MKVMVVSDSSALRGAFAKVIEALTQNQVVPVDHDQALIGFLDEQFDAVIICEYDKNGRGQATFNDIAGPADEQVRMIKVGFSDFPDDPDYFRSPFDLIEITKRLQ